MSEKLIKIILKDNDGNQGYPETTGEYLINLNRNTDFIALSNKLDELIRSGSTVEVVTDKSLTKSNIPADSKATGDKIDDILKKINKLSTGEIENISLPIATEDQAREGLDDSTIMTPLKVKLACEEFGMSGGGGGVSVNVPTITSAFTGGNYSFGSIIDINYTFASPALGRGTVHVMVDSAEIITKTISQGTNRVTVTDLTKGTHEIAIYVVDSKSQFTETLTFPVKIGTLDISSTFNDSMDYSITSVIKIPIDIDTISIDPINLVQILDGVETRLAANNGYNIITLPTLSTGAHKITIYAESGIYKSSSLTYNIIIEDADTLTLITDFDKEDINYKEMLEFPYRISMKGQTKFIAKYIIDGVVSKQLEVPAGTNLWSTNVLSIGRHILRIEVSTKDGSKTAFIEKNLLVNAIDYKPLESVKDASLLCWFDATEKTNNDLDKDQWIDKSGNNTVATMHNFNYNTNGWIDNALVCNGRAYVEIDLQALSDNAKYGVTVDIKYNTRDVGFQDACVLDMRGNDIYNKGFAIDTQYMYLNSSSNNIKSVVEEDAVSRATFVIDRDNNIAKIYNNGVLSETFLMSDSDNFNNNIKIYLGAKLESVNSKWIPNIFSNCEIYSFRVYSRALSSEEIVQNLIADIPDMAEQQEKYLLNYENTMPTMYFYGDTSAMTKENKVPLRIKYISTDAEKYGTSFDLENCTVGWQGTSSLQYAVKNYKIKLKNQDGSKYKYTPFNSSILEDTFCLKADYMESSHANNTGIAKFINNELYDSKNPAQEINEDCINAIDGFPIQLYIAKDSQSTPEYIGIFNFNLDKGCTKSFGLNNETEGFENCMSFEVSSNSDTSAGAFRDDSDESIRTDFELRYPDEDDCTEEQINDKYNKLKRLVTWVKNSNSETFKNELDQYFNKEYLLKYFLLVHLLGMVDNLGKNMMLTTWDGNVWYPQFYDMDTMLGLDNTGYLKFFSDIDIVEGTYNTSNSKLWTLVQEAYQSELSEMYKSLRANTFRSETILKYWYDEQVNKIGELQYNKDMEAKYIKFKNDYLFMLHGRRSEHMKKWINERLLYLDTIYGYEENTRQSITIRANTTNTINLDIYTYSPQYLTVRWRNGVEQRLKIGRNSNGEMQPVRFSGTLATATDQEVIIYNARQIKKIDGLSNCNPSVLNLVEASRLVEVDCINAKLLNDIRLNSNNKFISKINLTGCTKLGDTSTGKSSTLDLSMFTMLSEVYFTDTKLASILFPTTGCNLRTLDASSPSLQSLVLKNMPLLTNIKIYPKAMLSQFEIINCPNAVLDINDTFNNISAVLIGSENVIIKDCPKIFDSNPDSVGINITAKGTASSNTWEAPVLYSLDLEGINYNIPLLAINGIGSRSGYKETHIQSFKIDTNIEVLRMYGIGLIDLQDSLDVNIDKIEYFLLKRFNNIKSIKLKSHLKGVYLASEYVGSKLENDNGAWFRYDGVKMTSNDNGNYTDYYKLDSIYMDGVKVDTTIDFSNNPKMGILVLDGRILPDSVEKVIMNCDFNESKSDWRLLYNTIRFYLPVGINVEGYCKTTTVDKTWVCHNNITDVTSTFSPPITDWSNLEFDVSECTDLSFFFKDWFHMTKLPDSLTSTVINKCTSIAHMCDGCTALTDINKLNGSDINNSISNFNMEYAFNKVKGPFRFRNITISNGNGYQFRFAFAESGLASIGNIKLSNIIECNDVFSSCNLLTNVGEVSIDCNNSVSYSGNCNNIFKSCTALTELVGFTISNAVTPSLIAGFYACGLLTNYTNINIPVNCDCSNLFVGSGLSDITTLPDYSRWIKYATAIDGCFAGSKITSVPDLVITSATSAIRMFSLCENLTSVGQLIFTQTINSINSMFQRCPNLKTIQELNIANMTHTKYQNSNIIFKNSDDIAVKISDLYLEILTHNISESGINSVTYENIFNRWTEHTLDITFSCDVGTVIDSTFLFRGIVTQATVDSFAEHAVTLSTPYTLKVYVEIMRLFNQDILRTLNDKGWSVASL